VTSTPLAALRRVLPLLRAGLIAGVALASVVAPVAVAAGLAVQFAGQAVAGMPAWLTISPSPQTSYLYAADGTTLITSFYTENRTYAPLASISPWLRKAIVAAEDARFYEHHGVDLKGAVRAFVANNRAGEVAQGASTLTMQYVRNELRDSAADPQAVVDATTRDTARKLREMKLAVQLERRLTKQQILEGYLNVAYFGHRAYGAAAAAQIYFSKSPADLSLPEAALVAGLAQAPSAYDPVSNVESATVRRNHVLDRMVASGYLDAGQGAVARSTPIALRLAEPPNDCAAVPAGHNDWGFFCDEFKQWWLSQPAFGPTPAARLDRLRSGGYRIVASLDPRIQAAGMAHIRKMSTMDSRYALGLALVQPGTGLVEAMAVNRVYALDQSHNRTSSDPVKARLKLRGTYPNTVNMLLGGGTSSGYQAGSTFKLFTMLAALERGYPLNTALYAPRTLHTRYSAAGPGSCGGDWCPSNASAAMTGVQTMYSGFGKSVNTYWIQLEQRVGAAAVVAMAQRLGLTWHNEVDRRLAQPRYADTWGAFTLGVADTTPLEMAGAYATVGADGMYCEPLPVRSITGPDGTAATTPGPDGTGPVPVAAPRCTRAVSPAVARAAADAARCVTGYGAASGSCGGWSTAPGAYGAARVPLAGKTGTTDNTRAAWFVGFNRQLAGAAFVADPDNPFGVAGDSQHGKPIEAVTLTIRDALRGTEIKPFLPPPAAVVGTVRRLPRPHAPAGPASAPSPSPAPTPTR